MNILAFESSCDETAVALVRDGREVLRESIWSQVETHAQFGGVVPELAGRAHLEKILPLYDAVTSMDNGQWTTDNQDEVGTASLPLSTVNCQLSIDGVAVTVTPGLVGSLLVGVNFAKAFAFGRGLPLIPVNHLRAHIAAARLTEPDLAPPFLGVVVSGGHTLLLRVKSWTDHEILGTTRDDAAGEAFDKAARLLGLGYPGGPALSKAARDGDPSRYAFPKGVVSGAPLDMSFSGVKTSLLNLHHNAVQRGETLSVPDLAASFEQTICVTLTEKIVLAAHETGLREVVLAGGVAANERLRTMLGDRFGSHLHLPALKYCGDNAAMVGVQGWFEFQAGTRAGWGLNALAR